MKKFVVRFLIVALVSVSLCGCGGIGAGNSDSDVWQGMNDGGRNADNPDSDVRQGGNSGEADSGNSGSGAWQGGNNGGISADNSDSDVRQGMNSGGTSADSPDSGALQGAGGSSSSAGNEGLRLLSNRYGESACNTEDGYYYLTGEAMRLRDGSYGMHLMYMDFASGREIYLCSTAGCQHDSPDCPSVFSDDDFPAYSTVLFVFRENLYILSREQDNDGSMSQNIVVFGGDENFGSGNSLVGRESCPAAVYRANLDGTGREKIYTFDGTLTLEDAVFGNDRGIYVITKKLSADRSDGLTYVTSAERKLMFLDLSSRSLSEVCSMEFGDGISWRMFGCYGDDFVLCGTDFGRELSREEEWDDSAYKGLYENSSEVYALLNQGGGRYKEILRLSNRYENAVKLLGNGLYLSTKGNQNIDVLNLDTGERRTVCTLPQNCLMDTLGDVLCCRDWNLGGNPVWYFVDTKTGAITHSPLTIPCNGWAIDFCCETASDVLFVYDYDATGHSDGSYEIHQYKHALIAKSDLFAGRENYRIINMINTGK
ncbi:MAG: hypothetical protein NC432_10030 [Roseburia sp.]|nr:hypothetical protein [Roseburia sp.]MCM1098903.1 hypothetical protein [Ruminococcus flavefaciens]